MPKYGTFLYGTPTKLYGETAATPNNMQWGILVDWIETGAVATATNEAKLCRGLSMSRGREYYVMIGGDGFEPIRDGQLSITLDNQDGRFDPRNVSSPLYGYLEPGKFIWVKVRIPGETSYRSVFAGKINSITPDDGNTDKTVTIVADDGWRFLREQTISTLAYNGAKTGALINRVLINSNWPDVWGKDDFTTIGTTIQWYWIDNKPAAQALKDSAEYEIGETWHGADGKWKFVSHTQGATNRGTIASTDILWTFKQPQPYDVFRNVIDVGVQPYAVAENYYVFTSDIVPISIDAFGTLVIWANYTYNGQSVFLYRVSLMNPYSDYTVNTQPDGSGANLTGSVTVATDDFATSCKITITNTGATAGYVTLLRRAGEPAVPLDPDKVIDDVSTATKRRTFTFNNQFTQDKYSASDRAAYYQIYLDNTLYPTVQLENKPDLQYQAELFDTFTLDIPGKGISGDFRVAYIAHEWLTENGQSVRTTYGFEPYAAYDGYWTFPTTIGTTSIFGY
jgi:hypothetical protein